MDFGFTRLAGEIAVIAGLERRISDQRRDFLLQQRGLHRLIGSPRNGAQHRRIILELALTGEHANGFAVHQLVDQHRHDDVGRHAAHVLRQALCGFGEVTRADFLAINLGDDRVGARLGRRLGGKRQSQAGG